MTSLSPRPARTPSHASPADRLAQRLLDSPARQRILSYVHAHPGEPVGGLLARLDMGWGTLHHHLRRLEEAGLLHTRVAGRRRLAYPGPAGEHAHPLEKGRAILAGPLTRRVAEAILARPGVGIEELLEALGESPRAVYYHVKRLVDAGLVQRDPRLRCAFLTPTPLLAELLGTLAAPRLEDNGETCA